VLKPGSRGIAILAVITFAVSAAFSLLLYAQFASGYDLAIFSQAIHNYSEFKAPLVAVKGPHFNILGDHFHPILVLLAPLYWVWNDPRVLLLAQAFLIAASVPIVHRFAARHFNPRQAFVLAIAYAVGWPLQALAAFDFHEIAFGVPLVAWAIDSLDRKDDRGLIVASALLVLVREDMGLVVALLGALRLLRRRRLAGQLLVVAGLAAYIIATVLVLPHFSTTGRFGYWTYDALGPNPLSALRSVVVHPWHAVRIFFTPREKTRTLLWLFAPLAFVSLRSRYSVLLAPLLAERFLSSRTSLWTTSFHYSSIVWPILVLAAIDGAVLLGLPRRRLLGWSWCALPVAVAVIGLAVAPRVFVLSRLLDGQVVRSSPRIAAQRQAVQMVPRGVCVVADDRMAVHFASKDLVSLPGRLGRVPDYTVLNLSRRITGFQTPGPRVALKQARAQGGHVILSSHGVVVVRSATPASPSPSCTP